ncbi:helix-turn-helix domain-containing protein [Nocardia yamanashiensis]|uniref:helix-turn-helix domain-containing protein n=1 Tax=Nocardia yamanashiensis TaxID=209247 RepID=UPI00082ADB7A|nr:Scr1 family TA system antitoxin-like transcriptional regulator [Nocardia yamanashiensis]
MALDTVGTALIRRHIGRRLVTLRGKRSQEQVSKSLGISRSTIVRMEEGHEAVRYTVPNVKALLDLYEACDEDQQILLALAAETRNGRSKSWWHDYTNTELPEWFGRFVVMEDSATRIRSYESELIPGLLQTQQYAEAMFSIPAGFNTPDQIQQKVKVRLDRQSVLARKNPPRLVVVLNQAVTCRLVGGAEVMAPQLEHLLDMGKRKDISIRILPWSAGGHGGMTAANSFTLLEFPDDPRGKPIEPPLAYVDTLTGAMYLQKEDEFTAYERIWRDIDKKALSAADSANLIISALEGLTR